MKIVTLKRGTNRFLCNPDASFRRGAFTFG
jgi:hypothetical protein